MLYAIIGLLVIIADQWTKFWVSGRVPVETMGEPFIPGVVSFANVHNDGCAFSFLSGSNARIYFIILTGVFTLFVIIALATKLISGKVSRWAIVLATSTLPSWTKTPQCFTWMGLVVVSHTWR